jgi:hypothetical protein
MRRIQSGDHNRARALTESAPFGSGRDAIPMADWALLDRPFCSFFNIVLI